MLSFTETHCREDLFPLTLTRPVADIRLGMLTGRERWEFSDVELSEHIPANLVPSAAFFQHIATQGFKSAQGLTEHYRTFQFPWEIPMINDWALRTDFELKTKDRSSEPLPDSNRILGNGREIFLAENVSIEHCYLNCTTGPIFIDEGAVVMEGSMLRGPVYIGRNAVIKMGTAVYGATTIGESCIIGGEIKNSIFLGYSNKAHAGYIGDSVIGEWCNLGAGTSCSNLRNTATEIKIWHMGSSTYRNAGMKCGLIMGDHSKSSINSSFNTGTVVGVSANIFQAGVLLPKYIPSFTWGTEGGVRYRLDKALTDINQWMAFKQHALTHQQIETLTDIYNLQL